jgi:hypothetical protein
MCETGDATQDGSPLSAANELRKTLRFRGVFFSRATGPKLLFVFSFRTERDFPQARDYTISRSFPIRTRPEAIGFESQNTLKVLKWARSLVGNDDFRQIQLQRV